SISLPRRDAPLSGSYRAALDPAGKKDGDSANPHDRTGEQCALKPELRAGRARAAAMASPQRADPPSRESDRSAANNLAKYHRAEQCRMGTGPTALSGPGRERGTVVLHRRAWLANSAAACER